MMSLTTEIDINDLEILKDKEVVIYDTSTNLLAFHLAHCIRHTARVTYCVGINYRIKENIRGFRVLEHGKVVIIKGNLDTDRQQVYELIKSLDGKVDYEIKVKELLNGTESK